MQVEVLEGDGLFGNVPEGATVSRKLRLVNRGPCEATVTAQYNASHLPIRVTPPSIQLGPCGSANDEAAVLLSIQDASAGAIAGEVCFAANDESQPARVIVSALVMPTALELLRNPT